MRLLKKGIKRGLTSKLWTPLLKGKRIIMVYHDISDEDTNHHSSRYSTKKELFFKHISTLQSNPLINFVALGDLVSTELTEKKLHISLVFDDGFYSVYQNAYPFLKEKNIPFAISVNKAAVLNNRLWSSDLIMNPNNQPFLKAFFEANQSQYHQDASFNEFKQDPFLYSLENLSFHQDIILADAPQSNKIYCEVDDLKNMMESGLVTITSHSANHYLLAKCSDDILYKEVFDNKKFIQSLGGDESKHVTIPFGYEHHFDARLVRLCEDAGYKFLHTTHQRYFTPADLNDGINFLPSVPIYTHTMDEVFFSLHRTLLQQSGVDKIK